PGGVAVAAAGEGLSMWDPFQREVLSELGLVPHAIALPEDPLVDALLRAAVRDRAAADAAALLAAWPSPASLRADPAAKRALWPRLRRVRRGRAGTRAAPGPSQRPCGRCARKTSTW